MKNNKGFVLVTGLLVVMLISILSITATTMITTELKVAGHDRSSKQVFTIAEAGTEEARARLQGPNNKISDSSMNDPNWVVYVGNDSTKATILGYSSGTLLPNLTGLNYVYRIKHKVNSSNQVLYWSGSSEVTTSGGNIYVITSLGYDLNGTSKKIQIEVVPPIPIPIPGAVYAKQSVKVKGNSSGIQGENDCGFGGVPGITTIYAPGVNVDLTGSKNVTGLPQFGNPVDLDIVGMANSLKNRANIFHNPTQALSYGNPNLPNDKTACPEQIIYVNGNLDKIGGQGCGILVVNGNWTNKGKSDGELNWYGPIIVTGDVNFGGGGLIKGAVLSGGTPDVGSDQDEFGGSTWIKFCSSATSQLSNPTTPYQTLRWVELFN